MSERRSGTKAGNKGRRLALFIALGAVVAQLVPSATVAAAPPACDAKGVGKRPVRLCSVTKISGTKAGYVKVRLAKEITIAPEAISVTAPGRFAGFVFQQDVDKQPITIIGGRVRRQSGDHYITCCSANTLPAGTYRLYLITEGSASVTVKLPGLPKGTSRLSPTTITGASIHDPDASLVSQNVTQYYGTGVTDSIESNNGLAFTGVWVENEVHVATASGTCLYFGEAPLDAFAPGCPWRTSELTVWNDGNGIAPDVDGFGSGITSMTHGLPRGTYAVGGYALSGGTADVPESLVVLLELE